MPKFGICRKTAWLDIDLSPFVLCDLRLACGLRSVGAWAGHMTLRIERNSQGARTVLKLIGQIHSRDLEQLDGQMQSRGAGMAFDLDELTLVDAGVVRYLGECEERGVELLNSPPYIREWIKREKGRQ
jgi:hypothetical protein